MSKNTIVIPEVPDFFRFDKPFPSMDEIVKLCEQVVADLHEFRRLEQKASSWAGKLNVHDPLLLAQNRTMYYAGLRIFYRMWDKLEKTLVNGLQAKVVELYHSIKKVDCPNEFDVRDFKCNYALLATFRSDCITAFIDLGSEIKGPSGPSMIVKVPHGEDAIKALDIELAKCFDLVDYRVFLRYQRKGRAWNMD